MYHYAYPLSHQRPTMAPGHHHYSHLHNKSVGPKTIDKYTIKPEPIGGGQFSKVYIATESEHPNVKYAVKVIPVN